MEQLQCTFTEIDNHLLQDDKPSVYLNRLASSKKAHDKPFSMLTRLKKTEQSKVHHPEGNVWNHVMLVVDYAATLRDKSVNPRVFMWAALLHDIGKADTTRVRKGKISSYDHDKVGAKQAADFLRCFPEDAKEDFINQVCSLVRYHMHILFVVKNLPYMDLDGMQKSVDLNELALLGFADRMGRTNSNGKEVEQTINRFKQIVCKIVSGTDSIGGNHNV